MKNLYILGADSFGRELFHWLKFNSQLNEQYCFKGFLDDRENILDSYGDRYLLAGNPYSYNFAEDDYCLIGVVDPPYKEKLQKFLKNKVKILSFIPSNAMISSSAKIGKGCVISPWVSISNDTIIEDFCTIVVGAKIAHNCSIGKYSSIMTDVKIGGGVSIEDKVYIGMNATVINNINLGFSTRVGAGSVVINSQKPGITVFGNPAKQIKS